MCSGLGLLVEVQVHQLLQVFVVVLDPDGLVSGLRLLGGHWQDRRHFQRTTRADRTPLRGRSVNSPLWSCSPRLSRVNTRSIALVRNTMHRAAPFAIVLVSCASALQLPAQGRPRLVPLSRSDCSGGGGGLRVRSGPISCKTTDEDWARRWPNATPEELANMKKWCAAGPISAQGLGGHTLTAPQHRSTALHHCACCTIARVRGTCSCRLHRGRRYSARSAACAPHRHGMRPCLQVHVVHSRAHPNPNSNPTP